MRYYFAALFILALSLLLSGQSRPKQETPAQHKSNEADNGPFVTPAQPPTKQDEGKAKQAPKCQLPVWTDPFWPNWALVIITGFAAYIALGTLNDLKEQTATAKLSAEAAEKGANAALLNAQVSINSERAWVIIRSEKTGDTTYKIAGLIRGRTPAEILSYSCVTDCKRLRDMPADPVYDTEKTLPDRLLIERDSFPVGTFDTVEILPPERVSELAKEQVFIVWGRVVYRDILGDSDGAMNSVHESRFCFWSDPKIFNLTRGGPDKYNETT